MTWGRGEFQPNGPVDEIEAHPDPLRRCALGFATESVDVAKAFGGDRAQLSGRVKDPIERVRHVLVSLPTRDSHRVFTERHDVMVERTSDINVCPIPYLCSTLV